MVLRFVPRVDHRLRLEYKAMHDRTHAKSLAEWLAAGSRWNAGERPSYAEDDPDYHSTLTSGRAGLAPGK